MARRVRDCVLARSDLDINTWRAELTSIWSWSGLRRPARGLSNRAVKSSGVVIRVIRRSRRPSMGSGVESGLTARVISTVKARHLGGRRIAGFVEIGSDAKASVPRRSVVIELVFDRSFLDHVFPRIQFAQRQLIIQIGNFSLHFALQLVFGHVIVDCHGSLITADRVPENR